MARLSAGLLAFRCDPELQVFLVHPGGPFWARRDAGAWSIPKGEVDAGAPLLDEAIREFREETGIEPSGPFLPLGSIRQAGGKQVTAWAFEAAIDPAVVQSNTFRMEWPPRSGTVREFPEIDRAGWFTVKEAREKLVAGQRPLLDRLIEQVADRRR